MPNYPEIEQLLSKSELFKKLNLRVEFEEANEPFTGYYHIIDEFNDTRMTIFFTLEDISNPFGIFFNSIDSVDDEQELEQLRYLLEANCVTPQGRYALTKEGEIIYQVSLPLRGITVDIIEDIFIELEEAYESYREEFLGVTEEDKA